MPTLKGAFIKYDNDILTGPPNIIMFQFNPETMTRNPYFEHGPTSNAEWWNMQGPPSESIGFMLRLDASDQLARANPIAIEGGILPSLCALELLMYPVETIDLSFGKSKKYYYKPEKLPLVLFIWGIHRMLPVVIKSLSITEQEYDTRLNPTRAEVNVSLDVVTPPNLDGFAEGAYKYTQAIKKSMAAFNLANSAELLGSMRF